MRRSFAIFLWTLAGSALAATRGDPIVGAPIGGKPISVVDFADLRIDSRVAVFLPVDPSWLELCQAIGIGGVVYSIDAPDSAGNRATLACTNAVKVELRARIEPAPELYNSSDDPGGVYEYYKTRPAVETLIAPEPLDLIWIATPYGTLAGPLYGSPNMQQVLGSLHTALKPRGVLVLDVSIQGRTQTSRAREREIAAITKRVIGCGFELLDSRSVRTIASTGEPTVELHLKFRKS